MNSLHLIRPKENGNVLFIILVVVALFAALSYAVTSFSNGSGNSVSNEKVDTTASQILSYTNSVRVAISRSLASGCSIEQISFTNSVFKMNDGSVWDQTQPLTPPNGKCEVFGPNGGNIAPIIIKNDVLKDVTTCPSPSLTLAPGHSLFRVGPLPGIGTNKNDLVVQIGSVSDAVCKTVNKKSLGQSVIPIMATSFGNVRSNIDAVIPLSTTDDPILYGAPEFCFKRATNNACFAGYEGAVMVVLYPR